MKHKNKQNFKKEVTDMKKSVQTTKTTCTKAVNEAVRRMSLLGFPSDAIKDFQQNGKPGYCIEDDELLPLSKEDKWFIELFDKAGFTVYAAIRYLEESSEPSTTYLFVDRSNPSMGQAAIKFGMPASFIVHPVKFGFSLENKPVKIICFPDGMIEVFPTNPEEMDLVWLEAFL